MAKIKLTKTEMKSQQDALKQFRRFLPTLQLKKQQLQVEIRNSLERLNANEDKYKKLMSDLQSWIAIFGDQEAADKLAALVKLTKVISESWNIAGVEVPAFKDAEFDIKDYDLYVAEAWFTEAIAAIKELLILIESGKLIQEQYRLLRKELMTTTQRVNLFEKVKIPEARENIRRIRIYLSDMDTSAVARSKIAKNKSQEAVAV